RADARIAGSLAALAAIPDAELVPPGLDLRPFTPAPPSDRERPLVVHAPSSRVRKGTEHVIAACAQLPVDLEIVEGLPHDEARERYRRADIVVDQLNAGWHGIFALESMALGKPVVCNLDPAVVDRAERAYGTRVPIVSATKETLVEALRPLVAEPARRRELGAAGRAYVERVHDIERVADRLLDVYARL
ncbi:MAG TPA: glycosyltransferase, partial [Gaiellaceae bacterium]|nr:glycosyltransferase [Gaiellaceae bacterium]